MASTSSEAPREAPTASNYTKTKSKFSIPSLVANLTASFCFSKPNTPEAETNLQNAASSSASTNKNKQVVEAPPLSFEMLLHDLGLLDIALEEYTVHMKKQIDRARDEVKKLQNSGSSERNHLEGLRRVVMKLKLQIPTQVNIFPTTKNGNRHSEADLPRSFKLIHDDLLQVDSAFAKTKEYMDGLIGEINQAHDNFRNLQIVPRNPEGVSEVPTEFGELRKTVKKLKVQIPWHSKIRPTDSHPHPYEQPCIIRHPHKWPYINGPDNGMMDFFYKETPPPVASTSDFKSKFKAIYKLPQPMLPMLRTCLLCFFKFPPEVIIKRTTMIYLWIALGHIDFSHVGDNKEDYGNKIFDFLVATGFIEPIHQNGSLVPCSCKMSHSVRSALYEVATFLGFTSNHNPQSETHLLSHSCLINVGEAIVSEKPEKLVKNVDCIKILHLGRWQSSAKQLAEAKSSTMHQVELAGPKSSATHHIELANATSSATHHIELADATSSAMHHIEQADTKNDARSPPPTHHIEIEDSKILDGLKTLKNLTFLSLRGISMITKLPASMLELHFLEILDLQACHNLEAIPDKIGLLKSLTHLDMSECYFLEHMPKSLAQLSKLEVLKGFFIGNFNKSKQSCTLSDLSRMLKLRKLNIYVSVKDFHTALRSFDALENFTVLQKLTISWGGCSLPHEGEASIEQHKGDPLTLPPNLQKLNLQCFPTKDLIHWLVPTGIKGLKKLYISGGKLCNLDLPWGEQVGRWNVEILRLKYLTELEIDLSGLKILFPRLVYLRKVECPKFPDFSFGKSDVWMDVSANTPVQLQRYLGASGLIMSSSVLGSGSTSAWDDCKQWQCQDSEAQFIEKMRENLFG